MQPYDVSKYPYPRELFQQYDIFPLFVLDGGAFFFMREYLGEASGNAIRNALTDGSLLAPWMEDGNISWDRVFDISYEPVTRGRIEEHVWLNRLYFLLPVAQGFFQSKDEKWAQLWLDHLRSWKSAHPHPGRYDLSAPDTKWCWFDMQVTWRFLVMMHSINLLREARTFDEAVWREIYADIEQHLSHVLIETESAIRNNKAIGNHFLQKAVALLYGSILFPEFDIAENCHATGLAALAIHQRNEILADGCSIEACPSYSHFIARLYLEAFRLLDGNGCKVPDGLRECVASQYAFLARTRTPDGKTFQFSDSFAMDADLDLGIVGKLFPVDMPKLPLSSRCFKPSQLVFLKDGDMEVVIDAIKLGYLEHHHAGKPNLLVYYKGKPLVIDSGCSNYDNHLHKPWFRIAEAHNTVVVTNPGATEVPAKVKPEMKVTHFQADADGTLVEIYSQTDQDGLCYEWKRTVRLSQGALIIHDQVKSRNPVKATILFHFHPDAVCQESEARRTSLLIEGGAICFSVENDSKPLNLTFCDTPAYDADNQRIETREARAAAEGNVVVFRSAFRIRR